MDPKLIEARENVIKARESLQRGDKETARDLGEKAVLLMPDLEDAWLILVAADSNPEDRETRYLRCRPSNSKVLQIPQEPKQTDDRAP